MTGIGTNAQHTADMVQDDRRIRKRACEIDRIGQLRMILPGFETETEFRELCKALAERRIQHLVFGHGTRCEFAD